MGYGVPAAVAAQVAHPHRSVVCIAGDGCFLMNGQELATAMMYGAELHHNCGEQQHAGDDSDASGAPLSGAGVGDNASQSRFC